MLNSKIKLYAVLLGGRAKGCNIELHDVQFTNSESIESAFPDLVDKWFGLKDKVHVDSYINLDIVDGYEIQLKTKPSNQKEKLYFINLGAYEEGNFSELHAIKFLVDISESNVKKRAKSLLLKGKKSVHTDDLYDVDDCISISEVNGMHLHLVSTEKTSELRPNNGYLPIPKKYLKN